MENAGAGAGLINGTSLEGAAFVKGNNILAHPKPSQAILYLGNICVKI